MKHWFSLKVFGIVAVVGMLCGIGTGIVSAQSPDPQPRVPCQAMSNLFGAFDMSPVQMRDYLRDGGTLDALTQARGVDLQAAVEQWTQNMEDCTTAAVEAGVIPEKRGAAILAALDDGSLTPFPRLAGSESVNVEGIFMPGGWGTRPDDTSDHPHPGDDSGSLYDSPADDKLRPRSDGVFSPGGWGWVDRPDLNDITGEDWVGHPYYQGVFGPGGWGVDGEAHPNGVFHPGGWGIVGNETPPMHDAPVNDTAAQQVPAGAGP